MTAGGPGPRRRRRYRVDNLPLWLRPAAGLYGVTLAVLLYAVLAVVRLTCRFRLEGGAGARPHGGSSPPELQCIWHEALIVHIAAHLLEGRSFAWMQHPLVYMKPVHLLLRMTGVRKLVYGSTGHGGQEALDAVIREVRRGRSTLLAVDGPAGPLHQPKRGAFDLAAAARLPLTAIRYAAPHALTLPGWDAKRLPLPFTEVRIARRTIPVTGADDPQARSALASHLGHTG